MKYKQFKKELVGKNPKPIKDLAFLFGQEILEFRIKHGLTQEKLAKKLKVGLRTIKKLEQG